MERRISLENGDLKLLCKKKRPRPKLTLLTSSFWNRKRCKLTAIAGLNPCVWESNVVIATRCGLNFLPKQSVCTRCKRVPTRGIGSKFMSLVTIFCGRALQHGSQPVPVATRLAMANHGRVLFRGDGIGSTSSCRHRMYGWVPLAIACSPGTISCGKKPGRRSKAGSPANC